MPFFIDEIDKAILKSLLKDGRKSFRQISRETGVTTPTVKARFERLINTGFIKGIIPVFDFQKISNSQDLIQLDINKNRNPESNSISNVAIDNIIEREAELLEKKTKKTLSIDLVCDFCKGKILGVPKVLKFADIERFFCCTSCRTGYGQKYKGRIESLKRNYEQSSDL